MREAQRTRHFPLMFSRTTVDVIHTKKMSRFRLSALSPLLGSSVALMKADMGYESTRDLNAIDEQESLLPKEDV
jgi:hypothetical protein